jgi:hypothetical protein
MSFTIDKNIPIPPVNNGGTLYPFDAMKVGDSFFIPKDLVGKSTGHSVRQCALRRKIGVTVRQVDGGLRVWRTK